MMELVNHDQNMLFRLIGYLLAFGTVFTLTFPAQWAVSKAINEGKLFHKEANLKTKPYFRIFRLGLLVGMCFAVASITQGLGPRNTLVADPELSRENTTEIVKNSAPKSNDQDTVLKNSLDRVIEDALRGE